MKTPTMNCHILQKPVPLPLPLLVPRGGRLRVTGTRTVGTSWTVHQCYKLNLGLRKCSHPYPVVSSRRVMNYSSYDQRLFSCYFYSLKPKEVLHWHIFKSHNNVKMLLNYVIKKKLSLILSCLIISVENTVKDILIIIPWHFG